MWPLLTWYPTTIITNLQPSGPAHTVLKKITHVTFALNFLTWLQNCKREKTTVFLLFSSFIQFLAIEI